ncbi:hypothetical protein Purlil1_10642 [Purpureocillium lilacinum]|uniref:Tat pathway signal sequence n=1 Tax=Purpureocillium lilacinum TaxID=33203 RepID=A0ABR0BMM7_PURLI|nr:hypothetical protein Purlil1_10642 [Purpureocillium lilacinum]
MWPSSASEYERLNQAELDQENSQAPRYLRRRSRSTIVLLITNLLSLVALAAVAVRRDHSELESSNSRKSPAWEAVRFEPRKYAAEFRQTNKWRGAPGEQSDAIDLAWHEIELGAGGVRLTEEDVLAFNFSGSSSNPLHKIPDSHGGGYVAMLEVFHLLHCLNTLRMGLFYNYDRYKILDEGVPTENLYSHFDHCVDMLRESLMCTADITPYIFYDPLDKPRRRDPLPDWSATHTCRNFDAILRWNKDGPQSIRWRDVGTNPAWNESLEGSDPPFPPEGDHSHHHG